MPQPAKRTRQGRAEATRRQEGEGAAATSDGIVVELVDELGPLPKGWVKQTDTDGDSWFYNAKTAETSWVRPNADGSVPAA